MRQSEAIMACGRWLATCLKIGWSHDDLDTLEGIWWDWHDDYGRLMKNPRSDQ